MHSFTTMPLIPFLFSLLSFVNLSIAGYALKDDYNPSVFFDMFDFWTWSDPTHGFVQYIDQTSARNQGLISNSSNVYVGVDHTNITPNGRPSIRLTSKEAYNSGSLVILDLAHMPGNACGAWPAYWMVGPDWPNGGEIDIIEGVSLQNTNAMTLHTADGCTLIDNGNFTGNLRTDDCYIYADGQSTNEGCQITTTNTYTYGDGFNNVGGGVYAMEWTDEAITIWFFQRGAIPSNIQNGSPNPDSSWGRPISQFTGCCDIPEFFQDNQIVFDVTFCGDWAGSVWSSDATCGALAGTCNDYVANNPSAFRNAYWSINSLRVYEQTVKSSVKVALPDSCPNKNPTSTETVISASSTSTETVPATTFTTESSTVQTETSSTQTTLTAESSSTAETSSSVTTSSRAAESSSSSSKPAAAPTAKKSSVKTSKAAKSSQAPAPTAEPAAETSSTQATLEWTEVATTLLIATHRDATTTQWETVVTTLERAVDAMTQAADHTSDVVTIAVPTPAAPTTQPELSYTSIATTLVIAVAADATTTQWRTVATTLERVIDATAAADPTTTQGSTLVTMVAPDVYTTMWTTITSTVEYQKAKRTAVAVPDLSVEASLTTTTKVEPKPSPSRRWLPRHWGRART